MIEFLDIWGGKLKTPTVIMMKVTLLILLEMNLAIYVCSQ